ncbi:histidine kinase [Christensenellaceae bacterium OttesenSCG-928-M15]|nr:histidine kinase [Christensenellaceae bacterium OttesenSCG-928-M15]
MKSLYARLTYPVLLVLGAAVLSVILLSVVGIRAFISPDIRRITTDLMTSKSNEVDYWLQSRVSEISELALQMGLENGSDEEIHMALPTLKEYQSRHSDVYESMGIVSLRAVSHVTTGDVFDVSGREYYRALVEDGVAVYASDIIISRANEASVFLILTQIRNSKDVVTGYFSSAVSVSYLEEIVSRANIYDFPVRLYNNRTGNTLVKSGFEEEQQELSANFIATVASYPDWTVEMLVPDSFLNRQVNITVALTVVCGGLILLFAIFLNRRHARRLTEPIKSLENHMQAMERGEFIEIAPDTHAKELNSLGISYNRMLNTMKALLAQVKEEQQQKRDAEYRALCAQIKPHFLYNTLETIQAMVVEEEYAQAESAIGDLADFFRTTMLTGDAMVPLEDELLHLMSYLKIQKLRYEDRFTFDIETGDVDVNTPVMKFTLQPLIENAINHGIRMMEGKGVIAVRLKDEGHSYIMEVRNTVGAVDRERIHRVNEGLLKGERAQSESHGIFNVNRRLKLEFGEAYGVTLTEGNGWIVARVRHPKLPAGGYIQEKEA